MKLAKLLLGRPIADKDAAEEKLAARSGVPVLGLDALASAAYGPEAALAMLAPLGAAGLHILAPVTAAIVVLLLLVQTSYRQTIAAYPDGGGSYSVAKANLSRTAALCAGAALGLDYVLNVAVAISAGVGALVSAAPALQPRTLELCLALLALLVFVNLRGLRTAGALFMLPTWAFVALLGGAIAIGMGKAILASGAPHPAVPPRPLPRPMEAVGLWIALRAFASGCTAMTGVEAVSNAVPIFRDPTVVRARRTLSIIVAILCVLLVGIAWLARAYGIGASDPNAPGYQSVLSQLVGAVMGRGVYYYAAMAAIVSVLCLSANTSFADFPRLARLLALDEYLPDAFAHAGRRLVYSTGIVVLGVLSGILLVAFGGITDRLIPLFAVGAFSAFTLSQAGMVQHWRRDRSRGARLRLAINLAGTSATAAALAIIVVAKFTHGAWIVILLAPALVALFRRTRAHAERVRRATGSDEPLDLAGARPPVLVVPIRRLDRVARKAIRFAVAISPEVHVVQVHAGSEASLDDLSGRWRRLVEEPARRAGLPPPRLVPLHSEFREVVHPIAAYARSLARPDEDRFVGVLVPELVERRWYHYLLHSHVATALKAQLLFHGGPQVVIIDTPWLLRERRRARRAALHRAPRTSGPQLRAPGPAR